MARLNGMRGRAVIASTLALTLAAASLTVALVAAADIRADGRQLSQRLVPAAAGTIDLLDLYQAQQTWLRGYVTSGYPGPLTTFDEETAQMGTVQDQITGLAYGYQAIEDQLNVVAVDYEAWLGDIAGPQLAAMSQADAGAARALQADTGTVQSYVLPVRSAGAALQEKITSAQQTVTNRLNDAQGTLLAALITMCVVVAAMVANAVTAVWLGLLRPFRALRGAMASVTAGDYDTRIPTVGPAELVDLGRGIELMRLRLVAALADLQRAEHRFRRLFDAAPDAMIAVASDGSVAMANRRAVQLFGYPIGDLVGSPVEMLVPEEARTELAAARVSYFADPESQVIDAELKMSGLRRDGRKFPADITLSSLPTDSGMLVTAAIRDVSERLALQAERERLRAAAEQERAERRVQQVQQLESPGQLVGEDAGSDAVPVTPAVADTDQRGHGETILLVEDEESLRELTGRILTRSGYQVCVAVTGSEAVRAASDLAQPLDLLLTDVVMPEMLGNEVAARVGVVRPGVPALFMSGYAQPILDSHGVPAPQFDILEKPFTEAALLSRVRQALSRARP